MYACIYVYFIAVANEVHLAVCLQFRRPRQAPQPSTALVCTRGIWLEGVLPHTVRACATCCRGHPAARRGCVPLQSRLPEHSNTQFPLQPYCHRWVQSQLKCNKLFRIRLSQILFLQVWTFLTITSVLGCVIAFTQSLQVRVRFQRYFEMTPESRIVKAE
jgi:hypothetical protein